MACGGGGLPEGFFSSHTLVEAVAEPGFELSRVEQISTKFFWGKKSHVINKKWSKLMH
jgi:hypothetical protein